MQKKLFLIRYLLKKKNQVLEDYQKLLIINQSRIINENKKDLYLANQKKLKANLVKRLTLDKKKISLGESKKIIPT